MSWLVGIGLSQLKYADISYPSLCLSMSCVYFALSVFCCRYVQKEIELHRKSHAYVIAALCICMLITSWFNYVFVNPDMYRLLIDARRGDGLSWKNIYKTIEIIALLMVGKNGILYTYNWFNCGVRWFNAIIASNSYFNRGR